MALGVCKSSLRINKTMFIRISSIVALASVLLLKIRSSDDPTKRELNLVYESHVSTVFLYTYTDALKVED